MAGNPLDQLNPPVPGSDSVNSTVRIRKRGKFREYRKKFREFCNKFREFWGHSKSKYKKGKLKTPDQLQHSRPSSRQSTRPASVLIQARDIPLGDNQSAPFSASPSGKNQSTPFWTAQEKALSAPLYEARVLEMIFAKDVPRPTMKTDLPQLQQRIEKMQQLVYCNALLIWNTLSSTKPTTEDAAEYGGALILQETDLGKPEINWLESIMKDQMEADRLRWLVTQVVEQFVADANKGSSKVAEIAALGPVLQKEPYRTLLSTSLETFGDSSMLNVDMLQGLVQLLQSASPGYLESNDLVQILKIIRERLQGTHHQSIEHSYHLTLAVSRILDVMADHKVQDLDRVLEHEPLSAV
ncbi:hypothetical protein K457DRAFT_26347, partial [Linnemannia elongata AG-77]